MRREAAQLFGQVAWIHHTLDQAAKAAEAWGRQASLLTSLLEEEPASKTLRYGICRTAIGGGVTRCATLARRAKPERPTTRRPGFRKACSASLPTRPGTNWRSPTPCSIWPGLLSPRDAGRRAGALYRRVVELDRAAIRTAPDDPGFNAELALAPGRPGDVLP